MPKFFENIIGKLGRATHLGVGSDYQNIFGRVHQGWLHHRDDFMGRDINTTVNAGAFWDLGSDGSGTTPFISANSARGELGFAVGAGASDTSWIHSYDRHFSPALAACVFEVIVKVNDITFIDASFGFTNQAGGLPMDVNFSDGLFVRYETDSGDTSWTLFAVDGGSTAIVSSASGVAPVNDTYQRITVEVLPDLSSVMYVDGQSTSASLPAGSVGTLAGGSGILHWKARLGQDFIVAARSMTMDRVEIWQDPGI